MANKLMNNCNEEVKRGDVYRDMISGNTVIVISINKDGTVTLDDGRVINNMVCFKYIENNAAAVETEKSDFTASNGTFTYKGEKIVTGTLVVQNVIAAIPGGVIVTAADNRKGGIINVYKYFVEDDRFEEVINGVNEVKVIYENSPVIVLQVISVKEYQIPNAEDEDSDPVTVEGVYERIVPVLYGTLGAAVDGHFGDELYKTVEKEENGKTILIMTSDKVLKEDCDVDGYTFFRLAQTDEGATEIAEVILERAFKDEDAEGPEVLGLCTRVYNHHISDPVKSIDMAKDANDNRDSLFIVTEAGIIHTINGRHKRQACGADVVEVALTHPYCVRLEAGRTVNKFYLADKDYKVVCIKVTLTDDRGYVTEIENL